MKAKIDWAANAPNEYNGVKQISIKIGSDYFNCQEKLEENIKILKKGNEIEFEANHNIISNIKLIKAAETYQPKGKFFPKDNSWSKQKDAYELASTQVIELLKLNKVKDMTLEDLHKTTVVRAQAIYRSFNAKEIEQ